MKPRLFAFAVWAVVAASVMFWGLRLLVQSPGVPGHAVSVGLASTTTGDVTRLLGSTPKETNATAAAAPVAPESTRFKLTGVMSPKASSSSGQGVALISVDGKPARAFGVGARIDGDLRLQGVSLRTASVNVGQGKPPMVLEMPPLPAPNTGTLAAGGMGFNPPAVGGAGGPNVGIPAVSGNMGTVPRGIPFDPAALAAKQLGTDGSQRPPTAPPATMQSNTLPTQ